MSGRARRAVFCWPTQHSAREMMPVAEDLLARGWDVRIVLSWRGPTSERSASACAERGLPVTMVDERWSYIEPEEAGRDDERSPAGSDATPESTVGRPAPLRRMGSIGRAVPRLRRLRRYAETMLADLAPDVCFVEAFHSWGQFDNAIARAARRRGTLLCCIPMSPYGGPEIVIGARFRNLELGMIGPVLRADHDIVNRAIARLAPGWTQERGGTRIFMWDPVHMLAARIAGLHTTGVWQKPPPGVDVLFLESDFALGMLDPSSYPGTEVVVAGKPYLDGVFRTVGDRSARARLFESIGLDDGSPFLLWNVEPAAEHEYASWEQHWVWTRGVMAALAATGLPVVASLHPLCAPSTYRFVGETEGFTLALDQRIHDLYPHCTAAVSFPCSTNLLAPVFGTPLVIFDFLGMTREEDPRHALFRIAGASYAYDAVELGDRLADLPLGTPRPPRPPLPACEAIHRLLADRLDSGDDAASLGRRHAARE